MLGTILTEMGSKNGNKSTKAGKINTIHSGKKSIKSKTKNSTKTKIKNKSNVNELKKLQDYMDRFRVKKKEGVKLPWTHAIMYEPYGSFNIPEDAYGKFLRLYESAIMAGYNPHITENHKDFGPIVIDFDFVQSKENSKRYYTETTIVNIIKTYNKVIKKYLDVSNGEMTCYVSEKAKPTLRNGEYHDGIHIVYPYICTIPSLQMIMRNKFLKLAEKNSLFKRIPLVNSLDVAFDKGVIYKTAWALYRSTKNPGSLPYKVTHIFSRANNKIYDTIIPGENMDKRSYVRHFIDALSCRRFFSDKSITSLNDSVDPIDVDNEINKMKDKITGIKGKNNIDATELLGDNINFIKAVSEENLVEAKNLIKLFSRKRASDYYSWYQVGKCLHNIDYRLLADWIEFSKKTTRNNFKKGECESMWKRMKTSNYTMATLHYFASNDNPTKYLKMKEEKINKLIKDGLEASHHTIAKLLMEKYKFIYRCASIKHNLWYEFKNHRWIEIDSAYSLRNLISSELTSDYASQQSYLYDLSKNKNGYEKEQCINEATHISKVIKNLNNSTFKNGVIRECADIAYDPNFLKNLDENIYLICFENGVYDLESDTFREGCPDDYISLCTNYKYIAYDEKDEISIEIKSFIKKIQPVREMREYLLMLLSTCLAGSISEESFYVFTGSGSNGKSKLMELLKYTLGDLFKPMDILVLVGKRTSSSAATPELADKKGIRACPFDEPKATDEINTGFMKIFTGGDMIAARALFKEPIYFKPQFKPFLLCNSLPNIKSDDWGTWRRLKVVPFLSKFFKKSEAPKSVHKNGLGKNEFWADSSLSEKIPEWKETFMGMLINYYRKYRTDGLIHPKLVTQETAAYRKKCDIYQDFIGDYLEKTDREKDTLSVGSLHEGMKSWYKANYEGKCPSTKELRTYLTQRVNAYNAKIDSLTCYKIKMGDEDMLGELEAVG